MSALPRLVEFFNALPRDAWHGGPDVPPSASSGAEPGVGPRQRVAGGKARRRAAIHLFTRDVRQVYTEGTLLRVLESGAPDARRAAVFALGLLGSPQTNGALAAALHDGDDEVAELAADALWTLWFRGPGSPQTDELYRILRVLRDRQQSLAALDDLIRRAPEFAEAINQRAILRFRLEQFDRSAEDCQAVLKLNPHHFGAQAGLGQCYLRMRRHQAALRAFRAALRINPQLETIAQMVQALEKAMGD